MAKRRKKRVSRKRSLAAKKGWATRRKMARVKARAKRAVASRKGWRKKREASERRRTGVVRYEEKARTPHIPTVARETGVDEAIDIARAWGLHPDEWAEELAEDFDYEIHSLYEEYFYPAQGTGAW
jgi:hypothetical protein